MEKQFNIFTNFFIKNNKFRNFLFFFMLATSLWFFSQFSVNYNYTLKIPVKYINENNEYLPDNFRKDTLFINITTSGFQLVKIKLLKPVFEFRLSEIENVNKWIPKQYKTKLMQILGDKIKINEIQPPDIYLIDKGIKYKDVPIKLNVKMNFKKGYGNKTSNIKPEKIRIYGNSLTLDTIKIIETKKYTFNKVHKNINKFLYLIIPKDISSNTKKIKFSVIVDEFFEDYKLIDIKNNNFLFPKKVRLKYNIFKTDFDKLKSFKLKIVPELLYKKDTIAKLKLINKPEYIWNVKIVPDKVIFLSKEKK